MRIAIIVLTYNRKEYCRKTLEHLLSSDYDGHTVDVYVHDNASSDGTPEYLRHLALRDGRVRVSLGTENRGTAAGFQTLLSTVFDAGYDFIVKNDDDELFPDNWTSILSYWKEVEKRNILLVGFKRKCTNDYFEGLRWVSRYDDNTGPMRFGDNECYYSYITPGPMIGTESGWQALYPALSDFGEKFGGWDAACAMQIKKLGKRCLVVYNKECIHFQRWEDHPEYTKEKFAQIARVREKITQMRAQGEL